MSKNLKVDDLTHKTIKKLSVINNCTITNMNCQIVYEYSKNNKSLDEKYRKALKENKDLLEQEEKFKKWNSDKKKQMNYLLQPNNFRERLMMEFSRDIKFNNFDSREKKCLNKYKLMLDGYVKFFKVIPKKLRKELKHEEIEFIKLRKDLSIEKLWNDGEFTSSQTVKYVGNALNRAFHKTIPFDKPIKHRRGNQ